jgi:hypothetical protein
VESEVFRKCHELVWRPTYPTVPRTKQPAQQEDTPIFAGNTEIICIEQHSETESELLTRDSPD